MSQWIELSKWSLHAFHFHYLIIIIGFPDDSVSKESAHNARDTGDTSSTTGLGRTTAEGNGKALQYSYLGIPMDRGAWQATV